MGALDGDDIAFDASCTSVVPVVVVLAVVETSGALWKVAWDNLDPKEGHIVCSLSLSLIKVGYFYYKLTKDNKKCMQSSWRNEKEILCFLGVPCKTFPVKPLLSRTRGSCVSGIKAAATLINPSTTKKELVLVTDWSTNKVVYCICQRKVIYFSATDELLFGKISVCFESWISNACNTLYILYLFQYRLLLSNHILLAHPSTVPSTWQFLFMCTSCHSSPCFASSSRTILESITPA